MTKLILFLRTICSFSGWSCIVYQPAWNVLSSAMKIEQAWGQRQKKLHLAPQLNTYTVGNFSNTIDVFNMAKYPTSDL
jgi:hypothetical protein